MYIIYQIENIRNRKKYIGQTKDFYARKRQHMNTMHNKNSHLYDNILYQEMREYGVSNFTFTELCQTKTKEIADSLEDYFIRQFNTIVDNGHGYNNNFGGEHGLHSEETKKLLKPQNFKTGEENISYGMTGENAFAGKRVINLTKNVIYPTLRECAMQEYGDIKYVKEISKVCSESYNRYSYKGNEYRFLDDGGNIVEKKIQQLKNQPFKGVRILEEFSGKEFDSIEECASFFNLSTGMIRDRAYKRIKKDKFKNTYKFTILK